MRLSAIDVQTIRNFAAGMVELVEAGELAPKTVNNTLSCLSTCLKDAVALHNISSTRASTSRICPTATSNATGCAEARSRFTCRHARTSTGLR
ncbi:MAG TPA: hypothetical protein VFB39_10615 [Solirubrobacteraceae bacterium]|nr:hypothetical protein [Solirubrobacteraceae bacterium]